MYLFHMNIGTSVGRTQRAQLVWIFKCKQKINCAKLPIIENELDLRWRNFNITLLSIINDRHILTFFSFFIRSLSFFLSLLSLPLLSFSRWTKVSKKMWIHQSVALPNSCQIVHRFFWIFFSVTRKNANIFSFDSSADQFRMFSLSCNQRHAFLSRL